MSRRRRLPDLFTSAIFILAAGACSGDGCGCALEPLPGGALPDDQTVEGGAQIRVTADGFDTLTSIIPGVINDAVSEGFCLPEGSIGLVLVDVDYCDTEDGMCDPGCQVDVNVDETTMSVPQDGTFRIETQFDVDTDVHVTTRDPAWGSELDECTLHVNLENGRVEADVALGIDPATGELEMSLDDVRTLDLSGTNITGCGLLGDGLQAFVDLINATLESFLGEYLLDAVEPLLEGMIQGFLPDPLGLEGVADLTSLFGGFSPGTNASLELRMVPGGYVHLERQGLSLGMITGINADEDPATRGADVDSEPALCVPPFPAPDFAAPPASLPKSPRNTFRLPPANEFRGDPDPQGADLILGASKTFLNQAGHHATTSGALCLGLGTNVTEQLTLGTLGILVPSLAALGEGDEPLLLVTRPTQPVTFSIGEGTEEDPSLTAHIGGFEVDLYAFIFERYVRGFSLSLDLDVGVNLEFATDAEGNPAILPTLVGLESSEIGISVLNEDFLAEDKATLEAVLPTILDLALPMLAEGLGPITLPEFAGFSLTDLETSRVMTDEDEFLAITAGLGAGTMMAALAEQYPSAAAAYDQMRPLAAEAPPTGAKARLVKVDTPEPERMRAALRKEEGGAMPEVVLDLSPTDDRGRPLEWTWNLDGGMWRSFMPGGRVTLRERAFAIQGRYKIELRSRLAGDYRTLSRDSTQIPVVIDSVGPRIHTQRAWVSGSELVVPATDLVSPPEAVELAYGRVGKKRPKTGWGSGAISMAKAQRLARDGYLKVFARDELGNESSSTLDVDGVVGFHGQQEEGGCQCSSAGGSPAGAAGTLALLGLSLLLSFGGRGRIRRLASAGRGLFRACGSVLLVLAAGSLPACSCGGKSGAMVCEINEDCADQCEPGQVPLCFEGECLCADDVPRGRIGQYSDMSLDSSGAAWVSAYNSYHGDLMAARRTESGRIPDEAWEFIDGVPDGPVVVEGSEIRGGITQPGEDVGLYTSIGVTGDDAVMIAYFDKTNGSLKVATNYGSGWATHTVDAGSPEGDPELGYEVVGQYTAMTIRPNDQHPGIAYFAQVSDGSEVTTEVRFAQSTVNEPRTGADWNISVAASATVPEPSEENPNHLTIPVGTGLFVDAARQSDGSPVLVYYDRIEGDLVMSRFDSEAGEFAAPQILDGASSDVGWYPAVAIDENDEVHVSYVSASNDDLLYVSTAMEAAELVDDGHRIVGQTEDGLPKPEFHFIGDDSALQLTPAGPIIVYQDATSHELLLARLDGEGNWLHQTIAGEEDPFAGGYGFYATAEFGGEDVVMSSWVVSQPTNEAWVEIFRETVIIE